MSGRVLWTGGNRWATTLAAAALLAFPATALGAPGGDATVQVTDFTVANASASATVMCPAGSRATGGGAAPASPGPIDSYRIQLSGPVDETGLTANTQTGDVPRGWLVTVSDFGMPNEAFRAYAVCSVNSDAVIEHLQPGGPGVESQAPVCPAGTRAIGGGWGANTPVADGTTPFISYESNPVDETTLTSNTVTGDIPRAWRSTFLQQSGADVEKWFSICSAASDAVI